MLRRPTTILLVALTAALPLVGVVHLLAESAGTDHDFDCAICAQLRHDGVEVSTPPPNLEEVGAQVGIVAADLPARPERPSFLVPAPRAPPAPSFA